MDTRRLFGTFARTFQPHRRGRGATLEDDMERWQIDEVVSRLEAVPGSVPLFVDYFVPVKVLSEMLRDHSITGKMLDVRRTVHDRLLQRAVFIVRPTTEAPHLNPARTTLSLREAAFFLLQYGDGGVFPGFHMARFPDAREGFLVSRFYDAGCGGAYLSWTARDNALARGECWIDIADTFFPR